MNEFLTFTIVGLSTASILAVAASGLVVTYQTSGIFNFAHGAIGMLAAFTYWQLRFDWGMPTLLALAVVLLVLAPLTGVAIERVIMRGLEGTSEATKIVVSVSLLVAMLGLAAWIWPPQARFFPPFFPGDKVRVGDVFVTWHQIITAVFAVVTAFGLRLILHRSRIGVTMRAVVDDSSLVELNGGDPHRAARFSWVIGSQLAALAGILVASSIRLSAIGLTLLVVNAYAAAVVGRLNSLPMTFFGAVILGLLDAYAVGYLPTDNRYLAAFRLAIPSLFLFVALIALPHSRLRGHIKERRREEIRVSTLGWAAIAGALFVAIVAVVSGFMSRSAQVDLGIALGTALVALSLVPLVGFAGQISLCQMSFAACGAMMMAQFGGNGSVWGLVLAVVVAAGVGALVALPALRLRGIYLALATSAFAVFLDRWVFTLQGLDIFGLRLDLFAGGTLSVPRLALPGISFGSERASVILIAVVFALVGIFVVWLRRGSFGRQLIALRTSPAAAATLGVPITRTKFVVFALSAAIAGLGGALLGGMRGGSSAEQYSFVESLIILMMTVAGGVSLVGGALFAGLATLSFKIVSETVSSLSNAVLLLPGLLGIGLARNPDGVVGEIAAVFRPLRRTPAVSTALGAGLVALTAARASDAIDNWPFALMSVSWVILAAGVASRLESRGTATPTRPVPLERRGIERPWTEADRRELDAVLAPDG